MTIFVDGLMNPEGPVLLPDGSLCLVEMHLSRGWILWLSADGTERRVVAKTGRPNGMTLGADGTLWVAESVNPPSLLNVTLDGAVRVVATSCAGKDFFFPNDLRFGPDGMLYMTDSGVRIGDWQKAPPAERQVTPTEGRLYRIDPATGDGEIIGTGYEFTNGIAFGADNSLYVAATQSGLIYRHRWADGRISGEKEVFASVVDESRGPMGFRGPDGMAFGTDGNLYVAVVGQQDVTVLGPDGGVVRRIALEGPAPTNVAFGPAGSGKLYVTEQGVGHLEVHNVETDGLPLMKG
ncbi:MAG: SMP-30/gluconolactonase/LRE family protein [Chloroflexi bacterium]|nr:SMP-30/gluconolactonase/LRE family protein [Chloroflexota bacterium]